MGIGAVLMFVGPMAAVFVPMIALAVSGGLFRVPMVKQVAIWEGALYWTSITPRNRVFRSDLASGETTSVGTTSAGHPSLLGTPTGLWLFGTYGVDRWDGTSFSKVPGSPPPSRAALFVWRDRPAAIDVDPTRMRLVGWDGTGWAEAGTLPCDCAWVSETRVRAVEHQGGLALFVLDGSELRFRQAKLGDALGNPRAWPTVARDVWQHEAGPTAGNAFAVVVARSRSRMSTEVEVYRWDGSLVVSSGKSEIRSSLHDFGVVTDPGSDRVRVVSRGAPRSDLTLTVFDASGRVESRPAGGDSFLQLMLWPQLFSLVFNVALCLGLAALLTRWMRAFRGDQLEIGGRTIELASLTRRGLAQVVDSLFHSLPFLAAAVLLVAGVLDWVELFTTPRGTLAMLGVVFGSLIWGLLSFVLMAFAEAKRGKTPGKLLFGIRTVGVDLEPCGFVRALLRNMCEYADGMLTFAVGMTVAALTEKRQRLGDLAAQTLVIRDRG